jgi:cytochrome c553
MKLNPMIALVVGVTLYAAVIAKAQDAGATRDQTALNSTLQTCATCHGINGKSVSPTFPNLAAQMPGYIEAQLKAFKDQSRSDPDAQAYMWGMAAPLNTSLIHAIAEYFSKQPGAAGKSGDSALIARGKHVFEEGVPALQIPACATCHGAHAEGMAIFPRLAGQHAPYLLKQLLVIQSALRNAPVMHGVVKDLTKEQIEAVVAYLESI